MQNDWATKVTDISNVSDDDSFLIQIVCAERANASGKYDMLLSLDLEIVPWKDNHKIRSKVDSIKESTFKAEVPEPEEKEENVRKSLKEEAL
jgi:hypothetical protein